MALSGKDGLTTLLAVGTGYILNIQNSGIDSSFLSSPRWAIVILGILGIAMCAGGGDPELVKNKTAFGTLMTVIGFIVLILAIIGLIVNTSTYAVIIAWILLVMWLISTVRHATAK